jgi:hypothetical protein
MAFGDLVEDNTHIVAIVLVRYREGESFENSLLTQKTEIGYRSFPLSGFIELSDEVREIVLELLLSEPVSRFLKLSAFTPSITETIPIAHLQPIATVPARFL